MRPGIGSPRRTIHARRLSSSLGSPAEKPYHFGTSSALSMHWAAEREIRKPVPEQRQNGHGGFANGNHPFYGLHVLAAPASNCMGRKSIPLEDQTSNGQQRIPGQRTNE